MADVRNSMLQPASQEVIDEELKFPRAAYSHKKVPDNLRIVDKPDVVASLFLSDTRQK
jgi:hypothetical protein